MTHVLYVARKVILVTIATMHSVITAMALVILPRTAQIKIPPSEAPHHHDISCSQSHYNHTCRTDNSLFITDTARENTSSGQSHTTNLNVATGGMHPAPCPTTTVTHNTHPLIDALGDTFTGAPHISTAATHPWHNTLHTGGTLLNTLQTKASLVWDTLIILPTDHIKRRHHSHIHRIRIRSLFRTHSQTSPQNQMMTLILWTTRALFK